MTKQCSTRTATNRVGRQARPHEYNVNFEGGSGAMEAALSLKLLTKINHEYDQHVYVDHLVSDDDSTLRSHCQNQQHGGKLPNEIPSPTYLADPSHRIKVMVKGVFALASKNKNPLECKPIDAMRLK